MTSLRYLRARSRSRLRNLPGIARPDQRSQIPRATLLGCALKLRCHQLVVARAVDVPEHADRGCAVRVLRYARQGERLRWVRGMRVMHQPGLPHRLALLEVDPVFLLLAHEVEGSVVEDVAVL